MKSILIFIIILAPLFTLAQTVDEMLGDPKLFNWNEIEKKWKDENAGLIPSEKISDHAAGEPIEETEWNQFGRMRYIMNPRVGADGKYVNIAAKNLDAEIKLQQNASLRDDVSGQWSFLGPTDVTCFGCFGIGLGIGRVNRMWSDDSYEYAGSAGGGLWRRPHGGTWSCITDGIPNLAISGITTDPSNSNIIYILTGDGDGRQGAGFHNPSIGVLKSTDGGNSWLTTGLKFSSDSSVFGFKLIMSPSNSSVLYACTTNGLYKTSNDGSSWTLIYSATSSDPVYDFEFKPGSSSYYYLARKNSVVTYNGTTYSTNLTIGASDRIELAVTPGGATRVYALGGLKSGGFVGLYKSQNSGGTFTLQSSSPNILGWNQDGGDSNSQADYDLVLAVSPDNVNTVYVGGINVWKSSDGGTTWNVVTNWTVGGLTYMHADQHSFEIFGNDIWIGNDGGVYHSSLDNDDSYDTNWAGLGITQFYKVAVQNDPDPSVICGAQDNGTLEYNGDGMFTIIGHGDGGEVEIDHNNDYYFSENEFTITPSSTTFRPFDGLGTCDDMLCNSGPCSDYAWSGYRTINVYYFPSFPDDPFPYYGYFGLYEDQSGGGGDCTADNDYDCENGREILGFFKGSDNNTSFIEWLLRNNKLLLGYSNQSFTFSPGSDFSTSQKCTGLWMDENDNSHAWVTFGGYEAGQKIYSVQYPGQASDIVNISGSLPNVPINCVVQDPNGDHALYVGTDIGVFYRDDHTGDWVPFRNGMPSVMVTDLKINPADNKIYAATYGRGLYRSPLTNSCSSNITLTGNSTNGFHRYQADDYITSTQLIDGGEGNEIVLNAGNYVKLNVGFEVKNSSEFRALIEGCSPYTEPLKLTGSIVGDMPGADDDDQFAADNNWFELSPNPCLQSSEITMHLFQPGNISVYLTNIEGQMMQQSFSNQDFDEGSHSAELNVSQFSAGIYFVHVVIDGKELVEKLVKQ